MLKAIETAVQHWVTLIKAHEKLLIVSLIAFTVIHYGNKAYDAYGLHLKAKQNADNAQIATLQTQNDTNAKALTALIADVNARLQADEAKIANAKQTIIVQEKKNDAMTPPELYTHWQSDLELPPGSITAQNDGTAVVSIDAAHATVNEIDKVAPLTEQLTSTQDELKGCNDVKAAQKTQIDGFNTQLTAEKQARVDDAKEAKQQQKKSFWKGTKFGAGLVVAAQVAIKLLK